MKTAAASGQGWLDSVRNIGESFSALLRGRIELFTVEIQEEKLRLLNLLIWLGVAAAIGATAIFVGMVALAYWLWTTTGYIGVVVLALVALAIAIGILVAMRKRILAEPTPFAQTVEEFRKDAECLRS